MDLWKKWKKSKLKIQKKHLYFFNQFYNYLNLVLKMRVSDIRYLRLSTIVEHQMTVQLCILKKNSGMHPMSREKIMVYK